MSSGSSNAFYKAESQHTGGMFYLIWRNLIKLKYDSSCLLVQFYLSTKAPPFFPQIWHFWLQLLWRWRQAVKPKSRLRNNLSKLTGDVIDMHIFVCGVSPSINKHGVFGVAASLAPYFSTANQNTKVIFHFQDKWCSTALSLQTLKRINDTSPGLFCLKRCLPLLSILYLDRSILRLAIVDLQACLHHHNTCHCQLERDGEHTKGSNDRYLKATDCETFK